MIWTLTPSKLLGNKKLFCLRLKPMARNPCKMDSPRRSARLAAKPRIDYTEETYADINEYHRDTIHQMQYDHAPSYGAAACAGLMALASVSFIVAFVVSTSYHGATYSGIY